MAFLSDDEKQRIAAAIKEAECKTSGELVTVIAGASDSYHFVPLLWPALIALVLPGVVLPVASQVSAIEIYLGQVTLFALLAILMLITPIRMAVIPKSVKRRRASRLARNQFFEHGLHLTTGRTGVLIFVSVAERYVEIITDAGIDAKVPPGTWDKVVADFLAHVRVGRIAEGFIVAVGMVGDQLSVRRPRSATFIRSIACKSHQVAAIDVHRVQIKIAIAV